MRFTLAWLREYLEFESSVEGLCEQLTSIGLEVEELKNPKKSLDGFTICEIIDINPHPNANKLNICDVDAGKQIIKIVCGALNAKKNILFNDLKIFIWYYFFNFFIWRRKIYLIYQK